MSAAKMMRNARQGLKAIVQRASGAMDNATVHAAAEPSSSGSVAGAAAHAFAMPRRRMRWRALGYIDAEDDDVANAALFDDT